MWVLNLTSAARHLGREGLQAPRGERQGRARDGSLPAPGRRPEAGGREARQEPPDRQALDVGCVAGTWATEPARDPAWPCTWASSWARYTALLALQTE